jgi:hypothetical protein
MNLLIKIKDTVSLFYKTISPKIYAGKKAIVTSDKMLEVNP